MAKETLSGGPTGGNEKNVKEIFNSLSDKQKSEMFVLLNQEKTRDGLLENLDENNCCDRLLEAYKSFAGSEIVTHMSGMKVIDHPLFLPEYFSGIVLRDREKQIYHLDEITKDDIYVNVKDDIGNEEFTLAEIEDESKPLLYEEDPIKDKNLRDQAKGKIIRCLKQAFRK